MRTETDQCGHMDRPRRVDDLHDAAVHEVVERQEEDQDHDDPKVQVAQRLEGGNGATGLGGHFVLLGACVAIHAQVHKHDHKAKQGAGQALAELRAKLHGEQRDTYGEPRVTAEQSGEGSTAYRS